MNEPELELFPRQRIVARRMARSLYLGRDPVLWRGMSKEQINERVHQEYGSIIAMILVGLLVKAMVELIWWWIENNVLSPGPTYEVNEPGYTSEMESVK